jgi:hypothetical protein
LTWVVRVLDFEFCPHDSTDMTNRLVPRLLVAQQRKNCNRNFVACGANRRPFISILSGGDRRGTSLPGRACAGHALDGGVNPTIDFYSRAIAFASFSAKSGGTSNVPFWRSYRQRQIRPEPVRRADGPRRRHFAGCNLR